MCDRKLFAASLGLLALLCSGSAVCAADTDVHGTGYQSISQYLPEGMTKQPVKITSRAAEDSLPATYDPRTSEESAAWLSSVKNQLETGCCWAFSSLDCSAINARKSGLEDDDFDLSVWQFVYFNVNRVTDPLGLTDGDSNGLAEGSDAITAGGNSLLASMTLAQGISPALEETASFADLMTAWNLGNGDITLSDDKAYQGFRLKEAAYILPSDIEDMKRAILEYGAGSVSYYADAQGDTKFWNPDTYGLYISTDEYSANHAVTVVGWDDTYSKNNFGDATPAKDGAWLIKNTWGDEWGDGGYFWISYYDETLLENTAQFFSLTTLDENEHLYQYDGTANMNVLPYFYTDYVDYSWYPEDYDFSTIPHCSVDGQANVFTAQSYEDLKEVSFYTFDPNVTYTVEVYRGSDVTDGDPTGGSKPVATIKGSVAEQGYHTVALDTPVSLNKGESFSIVMKTSTINGSEAYVPLDNSVDYEWYYSVGSSKEGESYIKLDGVWYDLYEFKDSLGKSNLRIKAVTEDSTPSITLPSTSQGYDDCSTEGIHVTEMDTFQLYVKTIPANQDVNFTSEDETIATIDENGLIYGENPGTTTVTASFSYGEEVIETQVEVTVDALPVSIVTPTPPSNNEEETISSENNGQESASSTGSSTSSSDGSTTLTPSPAVNSTVKVSSIRLSLDSNKVAPGVTLQLETEVLPSNASNKTLTYTSSNTKYATVDSNGRVRTTKAGAGKTVKITATATDGSNTSTVYTLKIQKAAVKKVTFTKKITSLTAGKKAKIKAVASASGSANTTIRYTSSNTKYATVTSSGQVKALKAGKGKKVTITAWSVDGTKKKAKITIKIK